MIKLSQIDEGFLSKTYDRYKNGYERKESKLNSNLYTIEGIDLDLPFLIANEDLIINDQYKFDWNELQSYMETINKYGWRLPTWKEIDSIEKNKDNIVFYIEQQSHDTYIVKVISKSNKENIVFYIQGRYGQSYWCDGDKMRTSIGESFRVHTTRESMFGNHYMSHENTSNGAHIRVRLVKDKK